VERRDRLVAGDRLLVTSLLPECDASHAGSRASVLYAAPPPPPLPAIPGLPRRHFIHPARYLDFLDLPALRIRLVDSSPGHLGSLLSGPANSSNVQTCLPTVSLPQLSLWFSSQLQCFSGDSKSPARTCVDNGTFAYTFIVSKQD